MTRKEERKREKKGEKKKKEKKEEKINKSLLATNSILRKLTNISFFHKGIFTFDAFVK